MPRDHDAILLESTRVHRERLTAAFLHGEMATRRTTKDNVRRFLGSTVIAAVMCAGCAGFSFFQANADSLRGGGARAVPSTPVSAPAAVTPAPEPQEGTP
ncbi:hypothetical protein GCM10011331_08980 [Flavimobilis marinus]|uniref:Uncharacterized protein n=1 Tax=Flavimobilis marinus TaxID=285351 RepID=A0A1I2CEP7_9MICO|nr:hypothetical protein [Flavimobilis marinus]GHG47802.1 hypothetical protein GCM10011331_08980 [Flavimobilis marinus]SFE66652.1 hypothetical protein SAMN04488035_0092 [Flavimobilis marinus]